MKLIKALTGILLVVSVEAHAQNQPYDSLVRQAFSRYVAGDYIASGNTYEAAFNSLGDKGLVTDRYNAACAWTLAGNSDAAFRQLFRIAEKGNYQDYDHLTTDPDLNLLHEDPRWKELLPLVQKNKELAEAHLDKPLMEELEEIYKKDQKYRLQMQEVQKENGWESEEMKALIAKMNEADSINLEKVTKILDERGWLGPDVVGGKGNTTLFLVIQHGDLETQLKYLPMMREAVEKGNAQASSLALLEDRVALRQGKLQIYGSQIGTLPESGEYYVLPLESPDEVNERRASVGLGPIEDYIQIWEMTWDVEQYKKNLPRYIEIQKNKSW